MRNEEDEVGGDWADGRRRGSDEQAMRGGGGRRSEADEVNIEDTVGDGGGGGGDGCGVSGGEWGYSGDTVRIQIG